MCLSKLLIVCWIISLYSYYCILYTLPVSEVVYSCIDDNDDLGTFTINLKITRVLCIGFKRNPRENYSTVTGNQCRHLL